MSKRQKQPWEFKTLEAAVRLRFKLECNSLTDNQIKISVKAMNEVLLLRQQERASKKYIKAMTAEAKGSTS